MAYYDSLTGIANLTFHKKLITEAIAYARRYQKTAAIIYIGLDRFKRINDTLGYSMKGKQKMLYPGRAGTNLSYWPMI